MFVMPKEITEVLILLGFFHSEEISQKVPLINVF